MNDYYRELYASGKAHVQAGWRHPFEQVLRFAVACELIDVSGGGELLDVGCGPGALRGYLTQIGWFDGPPRYRGIDRLELAIQTARTNWPEARFECVDVLDEEVEPAETVMAIGAMISGEPCALHERIERVGRFVSACIDASTHQGCVVMLAQEQLEARASLGLEQGLFGVRRGDELEALCQWIERRHDVCVRVRPDGLQSDVVVYWRRRDLAWPAMVWRTDAELAAHVVDLLDPSHAQPYWRGWLYVELGQLDLARQTLLACVDDESASDSYTRRRARLLLDHLR